MYCHYLLCGQRISRVKESKGYEPKVLQVVYLPLLSVLQQYGAAWLPH